MARFLNKKTKHPQLGGTVDGIILHQLGCIKPFESWDIYHINWLAGFLNHQQHDRVAVFYRFL